jgi:hypothetical protein
MRTSGWEFNKSPIAAPTTPACSVSVQPSAICADCGLLSCSTSRSAPSTRSSNCKPLRCRTSPITVGCTPRGPRASSCAPNSSSSDRTAFDTPGCERWSTCAALRTPPLRPTATKASRSRSRQAVPHSFAVHPELLITIRDRSMINGSFSGIAIGHSVRACMQLRTRRTPRPSARPLLPRRSPRRRRRRLVARRRGRLRSAATGARWRRARYRRSAGRRSLRGDMARRSIGKVLSSQRRRRAEHRHRIYRVRPCRHAARWRLSIPQPRSGLLRRRQRPARTACARAGHHARRAARHWREHHQQRERSRRRPLFIRRKSFSLCRSQ